MPMSTKDDRKTSVNQTYNVSPVTEGRSKQLNNALLYLKRTWSGSSISVRTTCTSVALAWEPMLCKISRNLARSIASLSWYLGIKTIRYFKRSFAVYGNAIKLKTDVASKCRLWRLHHRYEFSMKTTKHRYLIIVEKRQTIASCQSTKHVYEKTPW